MLGWIYCGETNVNTEMVDRGYAWFYNGGSKKKDLNELRLKRGTVSV
jgi:endonuclease YncB( thermonuclease family)